MKGQIADESNTVSSSAGGRRRGLSENIIMSHTVSCSIVNSYACTGTSLLGCDAVSLGQWFPVFQRNTVPLFPRAKQPTTFS